VGADCGQECLRLLPHKYSMPRGISLARVTLQR
jgi:hypothetical protein